MTNVSFHLTNALPSSGEIGGLYFIKDGRLFVAESENNFVEINPIEVVSTLPATGIANKLYAVEVNGGLKLNTWVEGQGYKEFTVDLNDASITAKGLVQLTNNAVGQSEDLAVTQKGVSDLANNIENYVNTHVDINASKTAKGHVQVGDHINVSAGVISVPVASISAYGAVKYDPVTLTINADGQLATRPRDYRIDKHRYHLDVPIGVTRVVAGAMTEDTFNSFDWEAYDAGLLIRHGTYTITYENGEAVFNWSAKQYATTVSLIGARILLA